MGYSPARFVSQRPRSRLFWFAVGTRARNSTISSNVNTHFNLAFVCSFLCLSQIKLSNVTDSLMDILTSVYHVNCALFNRFLWFMKWQFKLKPCVAINFYFSEQLPMVRWPKFTVVRIARCIEHVIRLWRNSIHGYVFQRLVYVDGNWLSKFMWRQQEKYDRGNECNQWKNVNVIACGERNFNKPHSLVLL